MLRGNGYRPDAGRGHRAVVFQTLGATVGASQQLWVTLDRYHTRRNASEYGGMVEANASKAEELLAAVQELHALFRDWLASNRPGVLI